MLNSRFLRRKIPAFIISAALAAAVNAVSSENRPELINLTSRINTEGDDYAPSVSEDGKIAVFNSKMPGETSHNIFICENTNGAWGDPYPVFRNEADFNDETPVISADGKTIIFASDRPGGFYPPATSDGRQRITYDLYISRLVNGKWSRPELLKGGVNTIMNERAPGLNRDGTVLYFNRWPYNNPGRSRIYSARLDGGEFIDVKELPAGINSGNYEIGFRQSYRSEKYYFTSRRGGGLGGWDIYYTTKSGDSFTKPVNAGPGINTPYDDMYYSESLINSILSSDRAGGLGKFDLYSTVPAKQYSRHDIAEKKGELPPSIINVKAINNKNGKLIKNAFFNIYVMAERENGSVMLRRTGVKSGKRGTFTIYPQSDVDSVVIEPSSKSLSGCSVKLMVARGQIQSITLYVGKRRASGSRSSCTEAEIKSTIENNGENDISTVINRIYYRLSSDQVPMDCIPKLHRLIEVMRGDKEYSLVISGYADPSGPAKWNMELSRRRAENVAVFIKNLGIPEERITVEWFGESKSSSAGKGRRYYFLDRKVDLKLKK